MKMLSITALLFTVALAACSQEAPPAQSVASAEAIAAATTEQAARFAAAPPVAQASRETAYQFEFEGLVTPRVPMTAFEGDVVLVVNTASECGFTPQYEGLQEIYEQYQAQGFEVLGVPSNNFGGQEPGSAQEIRDFCALNYGVTFPMAGKTEVVGADAHPLYQWARTQIGDSAVPGWNFHKLLIGRDGRMIAAFGSRTTPTSDELRQAIESALGA